MKKWLKIQELADQEEGEMGNNIVASKQKYEKKRVQKPVSFNADEDGGLLDFANSVEFSTWVKEKIKEEINDRKK